MARGTSRARTVVRVILLLVLAGAASRWWQVRRAESWVPSWERPEAVTVVLVVPRSASAAEREPLERVREFALVGSNRATFWALSDWFDREYARYVELPGFSPVLFAVAGPVEVDGAPPAPPRAGEGGSFLERWRRARDFLGWFDAVRARLERAYPSTIYVYFYPQPEAARFREVHSVAERRSRRGFVFAPLSEAGLDAAIIHVAHELLHVFGATDKYDGDRCVFPQGFYEPFLEPRFPQRFAEVMAMGIPLAAGRKEHALQFFEHMRVGVETAAEIGWIDRARRDRYYGGDVAAGGRPD